MKKTKKRRVRRAPDEARQLILQAALKLLARHGPDAIGLKEVAREAGVSHALVTHYFGTYDGLVEQAFRAHVEHSRARTLESSAALFTKGPSAWVDLAFRHLSHPLYGRLAAWALLRGRAGKADFFPAEDQSLRHIADALAEQLRGAGTRIDRKDVELAMLLMMTSAIGYTLARNALWLALGSRVTAERDAWFRQGLTAAISRLLSEGP